MPFQEPDDFSSTPERSQSAFLSKSFGIAAAVLLALGSFFSLQNAGPEYLQPLPAAVAEAKLSLPAAQQYLAVPIRDLQVMQHRVMADNPLEDEVHSPLARSSRQSGESSG